jgi:ribosomal protein S18 acetylase RimI-like enzyme
MVSAKPKLGGGMQFELTEAQIDEILFVMEDQNSLFVFDTEGGTLINLDDDTDADDRRIIKENKNKRYIDLPEWDSSEGFLLMEHFAASLKNPLIQDKFREALDRGKGVFRAFKDVLGLYPEAEQLWYSFKEREMKKVILDWYNALRETWGLEKIGLEPEDTGDLILEDFKILKFSNEQNFGFVTLSTDGDEKEIGKISAVRDGENSAVINELSVESAWQGLGVGKSLLSHFIETYGKGVKISIDLPVSGAGFSRALEREGFLEVSTKFIKSA